jgi:hypothetical protein
VHATCRVASLFALAFLMSFRSDPIIISF